MKEWIYLLRKGDIWEGKNENNLKRKRFKKV